MRPILIAAAALAIAACGEAATKSSNNSGAIAAHPQKMAMFAGPVAGDEAKAIMHGRHEGMEALGDASKVLRRELVSSSPNLGTIRGAAAKIADLSQKSVRWFPVGTGPNVGKTGAKAEIWQGKMINPDVFAKENGFQRAATALTAAAAGNNVGTIKARFADLGGTCKACHDTYRSEMHH